MWLNYQMDKIGKAPKGAFFIGIYNKRINNIYD